MISWNQYFPSPQKDVKAWVKGWNILLWFKIIKYKSYNKLQALLIKICCSKDFLIYCGTRL